MYIWTVFIYDKNGQLDETSEPFISAEAAMNEWMFNHLNWVFVENEKFSGTRLAFWQAEGENYDYVLESQYVVGT